MGPSKTSGELTCGEWAPQLVAFSPQLKPPGVPQKPPQERQPLPGDKDLSPPSGKVSLGEPQMAQEGSQNTGGHPQASLCGPSPRTLAGRRGTGLLLTSVPRPVTDVSVSSDLC